MSTCRLKAIGCCNCSSLHTAMKRSFLTAIPKIELVSSNVNKKIPLCVSLDSFSWLSCCSVIVTHRGCFCTKKTNSWTSSLHLSLFVFAQDDWSSLLAFYNLDFHWFHVFLSSCYIIWCNVATLFLHPAANSPEGQGFCQAGFSVDFLKVGNQYWPTQTQCYANWTVLTHIVLF